MLFDDADAIPFLSVPLRIGVDGYVSTTRRNNLVARMLMRPGPGQVVAYRSENKHDLRRSNLYLTTSRDVMLQDRHRRKRQFSTEMVGVYLNVDRRYEVQRQTFVVRIRLKTTPEPGRRKPRLVYSHTFYDIYEAGYAYNRLCLLIHGEKRGVNNIPEAEVARVRARWGGDIPPGYDPSRVERVRSQGVVAGDGEGPTA